MRLPSGYSVCHPERVIEVGWGFFTAFETLEIELAGGSVNHCALWDRNGQVGSQLVPTGEYIVLMAGENEFETFERRQIEAILRGLRAPRDGSRTNIQRSRTVPNARVAR